MTSLLREKTDRLIYFISGVIILLQTTLV